MNNKSFYNNTYKCQTLVNAYSQQVNLYRKKYMIMHAAKWPLVLIITSLKARSNGRQK